MVEIATATPVQPVLKQKEFSLASNIIKTIVFAMVGLGLVVGNFFMENSFAEKGQEAKVSFEAFDYKKDNIIPDNGIVRFSEAKDFGEPKMQVNAVGEKDYIFNFESGKLWADFAASSSKVNIIISDKVVLIPEGAIFDLSLTDFTSTAGQAKIELNVYDGDVYVGFLPDGVKVQEYVDAYSTLFMNSLLVPRENQVIIPLKKVTEAIRPLLYSKLIKEFKFGSLSEELRNSEWKNKNLEADNKLIENVKQKFIADVLYGGTKVKEGFFSKFLFWSEENLTFVPEKVNRMKLEHLFAYLDDAIFYAGQGDIANSEASRQAFDSYSAMLGPEVVEGKEFSGKVDGYLDKLSIFDPDDKEYKVLVWILNKKFVNGVDQYFVVANFWQHFYRGLNISDAFAEETLNNYYEYFDKTRVENGNVDKNFYKTYLTYQNQLIDNLLMKYPLFYKDGYFAIKDVLENDLLDLYQNGQMKEELQQALVSNKINFLKRLKRFFFDGELEVKETKEIFKRLFGEIDSLMPKTDAGLAVIELFEQQMDDMDDFWGYLNSPEYQTKTYGATHEDRFKFYLQERETIWNFIKIKEDVLGELVGKADDITVVDVVDEIKKVLEANEDVSKVEVGKIEEIAQRYVVVNFVLGGYPVEASYDRDNVTLKDVKVYDELVSDHAVKLTGLLGILQEKFADLAKEDVNTKDAKEEAIGTTAQRFARKYISKEVNKFGFQSTEDNVKVVDQLEATYRVEDVGFKDLKDTKVSFDVLMSGELATSVFVTVNGKSRILDGKYSFEELATMVQAEYDFTQNVEKEPDIDEEEVVDDSSIGSVDR